MRLPDLRRVAESLPAQLEGAWSIREAKDIAEKLKRAGIQAELRAN